ncbi:unnamed protein product [Ilex paraguariensis]|uniref:Uncharacterized protein n=1 Tax=Ilex paraguariensis TaxID=185542 RepID=A0ABC8V310_9AQUA
MDREQEEMQFLSLFGIYTEAYKVIITWRRIFSQITLALILPLSFIFLAHIEVSDVLLSRIWHTEFQLDRTRPNTPRYSKLSDLISTEWTYFLLFKALYFTFLLIFSLLCTSAVVYTIACIYTARELSFRKVMSVVPKVWKRLMITFLCTFFFFFIYNVVAIMIIMTWALTAGFTKFGTVIFFILLIIYSVGSVYLSIIWHLASVVSVLEDSYGVKAMIKSKDLIKGKMVIAVVIFLKLNLSLFVIQFLFENFVVYGESLGTLKRLGLGVLCFLLLFKLILFGLVIQTIIYFVCKSYHHENIDKSTLSDHLEVYLGEYVPLKAQDIQLEHYEV